MIKIIHMRKMNFANGEYYHIFNRGVDKRNIFANHEDYARFFQSVDEFNSINPIGSIYENSFRKNGNQVSRKTPINIKKKLVGVICYCFNPNHYHFILKQLADRGIEKFMHKLGVGYTKYFNQKHDRSGVLFQGAFKAIHIDSNEYLLHLSAYVNLNNLVHKLGNSVSKSSWNEYMKLEGGKTVDFCEKNAVLSQFRSTRDYKEFAEESLIGIKKRKDLEKLFME